MNQPDNESRSSRLTEIVKAVIVVLFAGVVAYKIIVTPLSLAMDFYALLSLLLALFSVGLSALFYFKATDTSNAFYDNTYKFTKDIAELLVRIESGFGERLRHLDEGYTRMQDRVYHQPLKEDLVEKQEQVKREEKNFNEKLQEREKLIEELVQKSQLADEEKQRFRAQLRHREEELSKLQLELVTLKEQALKLEAMNRRSTAQSDLLRKVQDYAVGAILSEIPAITLITGSPAKLNKVWQEIYPGLPNGFLNDLKKLGIITSTNELTRKGIIFLRELGSTIEAPPSMNKTS